MITLDSFAFPSSCNGLRWSDELAWSAVAQSTDYGLTGALLVQEGTRSTGRPLTLSGGRERAWISRSDLLALHAMLESTAQRVLTLHDGRQIPVIPRRDGDGPLKADSLREVADPDAGERYFIDQLRFWIVGDIA